MGGALSRWVRRAGSLALTMGLVSLALPAGPARAQITATFTNPLTITEDLELDFGSLIPGTIAGTVTIAVPSGSSTRSGIDVIFLDSTFSHGEFTVTGDGGAAFTITLPASITLSGPGADMTVDTFTTNPASPTTIIFTGEREVRVGATLHVGAFQAAGSYTGPYTITVEYQ